MPAQLTTVSALIGPYCVVTPAARPRSVRMPVTATSSTSRAPPSRAPRASAMVVSVGLVWPSVGKWMAPITSRVSSSGQSSLIRAGDVPSSNVYKATLTVQAARPVYNTSYESPLINFMDDAVMFKAVQTAFSVVKSSGTYCSLIQKWGLTSGVLVKNNQRICP